MFPGFTTLVGHLSNFHSLSGFQVWGTFYLKKYETCAPASHCPSLPVSPVSRGEPPEQVQNLGLDRRSSLVSPRNWGLNGERQCPFPCLSGWGMRWGIPECQIITNYSAPCRPIHPGNCLVSWWESCWEGVHRTQMLSEKRLRNDKEVYNYRQHCQDARELGMEMNAGDPRTRGAQAGES